MATGLSKLLPLPDDEERRGGLTEAQRHETYQAAGYAPFVIKQLESMVCTSGLRAVGKGALDNLRVHFSSRKSHNKIRVLESHTCERVLAYELELDPDVTGYYTQVHCAPIVRILEGNRKHVSHATIDFLVFRRDRVDLVECKTEEWLSKQKDDDWVREDGGWTYPPYKRWAQERNIAFSVWTPPTPVAPYLRTLEAMYDIMDLALTPEEERTAKQALARIAEKPYSIGELEDTLPGFRAGIALRLLAERRCFGLITSTPFHVGQHFYLYADASRALEADARARQRLLEGISQPTELDAISMATTTDYNKAKAKIARLDLIAQGKEKNTVRMRQLAAKVREAISRGESALSACITNYAKSGNRYSRFNLMQQQCMEYVIRVHWLSGNAKTRSGLWSELKSECQRHQVETPHPSTLNEYLRREDPARRALAAGGMRAYQAARPLSDPVFRSGDPLGYGHTLHIDSSQFDARTAPEIVSAFDGNKPWFYIGVDGATRAPMARSFYFGKARTDGVALLLRDFVRRHGFLPRVIILDRGPENTSNWLKCFCEEMGITLIYTATGGSRYNSQAETAIRQVNHNVAHQLPGSTEPDMKGRKVDGKYKSKNTAHMLFMALLHAFDIYVFEDLPRTPGDDDLSPLDRMDNARAKYGVLGRPQAMNDDFLIKTSVDIEFTGKATERRGIKLASGIFTSQALSLRLRTEQPDQVRVDCEDPAVIYVKIGSDWIKAGKNNILTMACLDPLEKLFELLWAPMARRNRQDRKRDIDHEVYQRNKGLAEANKDPAEDARAKKASEKTPESDPTEDSDESDCTVPSWDELKPLAAE